MTTLGSDVSDMFDELYEVAGVELSVTRGAGPAVVVDAIVGRTTTERHGDEQIYLTGKPRDFIVKQAEYITKVGGEPQTNDYFEFTDDRGNLRTMQVTVNESNRHYEESGQFGLLWRIHTTEQ